MKITLYTILCVLISGQLCTIGLPWWAIAPLAAVTGWIFAASPGRSFVAGFLGGFLSWFLNAFWLDRANEGLLSGRVGALFLGLSGMELLLLSGLLGGLLAGMGCLTGRLARNLVGQPAKVG